MIASMNPVRPPFTKVPDCQTWQNGSASKIAIINWLVVEPPPSETYDFVSWDDDIPNICKNKKCSKPPTSKPDTTP